MSENENEEELMSENEEELSSSPLRRPAIVIRQESADDNTLYDVTPTSHAPLQKLPIAPSENPEILPSLDNSGCSSNQGTPKLGHPLLNSKLLRASLNTGSDLSLDVISSDCSDLEEVYLEPEGQHNITDIAFAEDDMFGEGARRGSREPTFEISLCDIPRSRMELPSQPRPKPNQASSSP